MSTHPALRAVCDDVTETANELAADPQALGHVGLDEAVRLLVRVAEAVDALNKSVRPALERHILQRLDGKEHTVGGVTVTKRQARAGEVYDNAAILGQVVTHALADRKVDEETGEIEDPAWVTAKALDRVYGITDKKSTKPRTTVLADYLGWDKDELDEYRAFEGWRPPTLQLTRPKATS